MATMHHTHAQIRSSRKRGRYVEISTFYTFIKTTRFSRTIWTRYRKLPFSL